MLASDYMSYACHMLAHAVTVQSVQNSEDVQPLQLSTFVANIMRIILCCIGLHWLYWFALVVLVSLVALVVLV